MLKIAIQGIEGSNHHIAAEEYFQQDIDLVKCNSFSELIKQLVAGSCDFAVMAIENSIAGSIIPNYELMRKSKLNIVGEHYVQIEHHLLATHKDIDKIKKVYSHPMALLQCERFFKQHPTIQLIEYPDTALAAKKIEEDQNPTVGAIANSRASELFNNIIVTDNIQTIKNNQTRFFILSKQNSTEENNNKISLWFTLNHESGSLAEVLNIMNKHSLNMTKIQSLPIIEKPWEYSFFVDATFQDKDEYQKCIIEIEKKVNDFNILGEYRNKKKRS